MMRYADLRAQYRLFADRYGAAECMRRYVILCRSRSFIDASACALLCRAALFSQPMTISLVRRAHLLCMRSALQPLSLLSCDLPFPGDWKTKDNGGCPVQDCESLTADFVQEFNSFGRGNPLFYAAYTLGTLTHIAPFACGNLECAAALTVYYFARRNLPPVLFFREDRSALENAAAVFRREETLSAFLDVLFHQAQKTARLLWNEPL